MEHAGTELRHFYDAVRQRNMKKGRGYLADDMAAFDGRPFAAMFAPPDTQPTTGALRTRVSLAG